MNDDTYTNPFSDTTASIADSRMETMSLGSHRSGDYDDGDDLEQQPQPNEQDRHVHDLPSVEEYKAGLGRSPSISKAAIDLINEDVSHDDVVMMGGMDDLQQDEAILHDQLPSVEEVKMNASGGGASKSSSSSNSNCCRNFGITMFLLAILLAVGIPAVIMTQDNRNNAFSKVPPSQLVRLTRLHEYLVEMNVSSHDDLLTVGTSQYWASLWMTGDEEFQMEFPNVEEGAYNPFVERYALAVLFYATGGPAWEFSMNFLDDDKHVCDWYGDFRTEASDDIVRLGVHGCLTADGSEEKFVTHLALPFNDLVGKLPEEIKFLHHIKSLHLQFNGGLSKSIPAGLAEMTNLEDLQLQYCSFTGTIPDWSNLRGSLTTLGLGNNLLTGVIPTSLSSLSKLEILGLDDNSFFGSLEPLKPMTSLRSIYLEDNSITGQLTDDLLAAWSRLEELDLSMCGIHSTLPSSLFSHPSLSVVDLHGNKFHGNIPVIASENPRLEFLALHDNQLGSTIPPSINMLRGLTHLDLSVNQFTLPFPSSMGQLTKLKYLFAGQNPQLGKHEIPTFINKLVLLRELSLKNNQMTGSIPAFITDLKFLQLLDLDGNQLTGSIPKEVVNMSGLDHLLLNRNQLTGTIPDVFSLMTDLDVLLLDGNNFSGSANVICNSDNINLAFFVTDCAGETPEVECSCCNLCCKDDDKECNNLDWSVNLDPIWEYGYTRHVYKFGQDLLPPAP